MALAAYGERRARLAPGLLGAVLVAALVDTPLLRIWRRHWEFPSGAVLTGLLVAMVLSPHEPWYVAACTSAIAVVSKYLVRTRTANVFNPAAVGLVATFYMFDAGHSWWGAMPDIPVWVALPVLFATGTFIAGRVNRIPLVLAFLGTYFLLFSVAAFAGDPRRVAEAFVTPDLQAVLFFAFFILTDPPTSPIRHADQVACGALVAAIAFGVFEWVGAAYYLLAGALAGNVLEGWRRRRWFRQSRARA
ncbi:MAG: RnfABCDGE type electron transport complex subunit D [Acidobacteriota bacterium]